MSVLALKVVDVAFQIAAVLESPWAKVQVLGFHPKHVQLETNLVFLNLI